MVQRTVLWLGIVYLMLSFLVMIEEPKIDQLRLSSMLNDPTAAYKALCTLNSIFAVSIPGTYFTSLDIDAYRIF